MATARRNHETEVKIHIRDPRAFRARLKELGFVELHPRALEDNVLFDTPQRDLRQVRSVMRLRKYGSESSITYKGTPEPDETYKSRVEVETNVSNPAAMREVFQALGLVPVFRYQKYRTKFSRPSRERKRMTVEIALDETPIGYFIELEGSRRAIDLAAKELNFSRKDYSTASYGALYLEHCKRKGIQPSDMVFPAHRDALSRRARGADESRREAERPCGGAEVLKGEVQRRMRG